MLISITAGTVSAIPSAPGINRRLVQNVSGVDVYIETNPLAGDADVISGGVLLVDGASLIIDNESAGQPLYASAAANAALRVMDWGRVQP